MSRPPVGLVAFAICLGLGYGLRIALMPAVLHIESAEQHAAWLGEHATVAAADARSHS